MKRSGKIFAYVLVGLILIFVLVFAFFTIKWKLASSRNMALLGPDAPKLTINGYQFRDLNKNGRLDTYEDSRAELNDRVDNLTQLMSIEEKAGLMFITMIGMNTDGSLGESPTLRDPLTFILESNSPSLRAVSRELSVDPSFMIIHSQSSKL